MVFSANVKQRLNDHMVIADVGVAGSVITHNSLIDCGEVTIITNSDDVITFAHPSRCEVVRWVDGDTLVGNVTLGPVLSIVGCVVRLHGVNCPELSGGRNRKGVAALNYVKEKWPAGCLLDVNGAPKRLDLYKRAVLELWYNGRNIAEDIIMAGHGVRCFYQ